MSGPRLRYAPSPTGDPHVGNIRTALWTWLHARRHGGAFVLRLEDTDQGREIPGSLERIQASLRWLGLEWDEGPDKGGPYAPYVQSQRLPSYHDAVDRLLASDAAYRCFCSAADLGALRDRQRAAGAPPGYDGRCSTLLPDEAAARAVASEPHVVRFRMPRDGVTTFTDLLRGEITYENHLLDDFIILKTDGFPTYHLAHVVDDHAMAITHVTRGEEWIPSTPRHVRLFEALGYPLPIFVHTPVILGPDGGKLSKRHGARSVLDFAAEGYLPEALFNFLAIMGWSPDGATELLSRDAIVAAFDLQDLAAHPGVFDTQKLEWMNGVYMRALPEPELAALLLDRLDRDLPPEAPRPIDAALVAGLVPLVRERIKLLADIAPLVDFCFVPQPPPPTQAALLGKAYRGRPAAAAEALVAAADALRQLAAAGWSAPAIEATLRALVDEGPHKPGELFMLCRLAVTGKAVTPPLFETMALLGAERCLASLAAAEQIARAATIAP
ncbi:MAG: glutamate--tRNA ligase [Dehalococcoidia bacterium]|nr:glutamate--tRNA ligase [Dehalococcoidia bacterium]